MKRRFLPFFGIRTLLALCAALALTLSLLFCVIRCAAEPAEEASSAEKTISALSSSQRGGIGGEFPYLLGTGVLLGMIIAVRLRRKAERDPTRRRRK